MIIKGKSRAGARHLGNYLSTEGENERIELLEVKGTVAQDIRGALAEMDAYAIGTLCSKPLYHAMINPEPPYRLSPEQRMDAIDALEEQLGLAGHARVVVLHSKFGREHLHVVWSRIDLERMKSVSDSHNYRRHEIAARELERRFGHPRVQGAHHERENVPRPERTPSRAEWQQEVRSGIKGKEVKAEVSAIFRASDGAESFRAGLEDHGYQLARGDDRLFVIIDRQGGVHSLARRLDGLKAAELREFMRPIELEKVPTIDEAKTLQLQRTDEPALIDRQIEWEDQLASAAIETTQRKAAEEDRMRRARLAAGAEARSDAAYAHGDDYVSQSRAAQRHFERRQKELNKTTGGDSLWDRIEAGDAERERRRQEERARRIERLLEGPDDRDLEPDRKLNAPGRGQARGR